MPTQHILRILLVIPANRLAAVMAWFQANIGPNAVSATAAEWPGLSASGNAPATYYWMCGAFRDEEARLILRQLCQLASVAPPTPAQWTGWTRTQKIVWLRGVETTIRTNYGALVRMSDNEGDWDDPASALAALGLQTISSAAA